MESGTYALFDTSEGSFTVSLFEKEAPNTVANFVGLAEGTKAWTDPSTGKPGSGPYYNGIAFHRIDLERPHRASHHAHCTLPDRIAEKHFLELRLIPAREQAALTWHGIGQEHRRNVRRLATEPPHLRSFL